MIFNILSYPGVYVSRILGYFVFFEIIVFCRISVSCTQEIANSIKEINQRKMSRAKDIFCKSILVTETRRFWLHLFFWFN